MINFLFSNNFQKSISKQIRLSAKAFCHLLKNDNWKLKISLFAIFLIFIFANNASASSISRPQNNLGLVSYWSFEDATGTKATDFSGNGNTGTFTNSPTWINGKIGKSILFNGVNQYVASTNTKKIGLGFVGSISFWAKGSGDVVSNHRTLDGVNVGDGMVMVNTDGTLTYKVNSNALPPYGYSLTTTRSAATSTWNFYTLVLNVPSSTGTLSGTLYINGVAESLSTSITTGQNGAVDANFADIDIGAHRNSIYGTSYFTGSIDEVRIYSRSLSATEVTSLYNNSGVGKVNKSKVLTGSSLDSGLVGYWTFDGSDISGTTAYDRSGSGNNGTLTNGPTRAIGKVGQALSFDGLNAGVYTSKPNFTSAGMTISMWIKPNSSFGTNDNFIGVWDNAGWLFRTGFDVPQRIEFYDGATSYETSSSYLTSGVWQYVTVTQDTSGVYRIYYNGTVVYTSSTGMPVPNAGSNVNMSIGRLPAANAYSFPGSIDEVRIYNRALSASEVSKLYNLNATKFNGAQQVTGTSLDSGLVGYWSFNGPDISGTTAYDRSGQGNNGTLTNGPTQAIGKVGQALNFDGVDDYVVVGSLSNPPSINAITMSSWIYWKSSTESYNTILENYGGSSGYGILLRSDQKIASYFNNSGGYIDGGGSSVPFNTWTHIVSTYDGANVKIYINGVLDQTLGWVGSFSNNTNLRIGHDQFGAGRYFNGAIDDVRIYNRALSASEVKLLYNLGR